MGHGRINFDKQYYKRFFDKYSKSELDKLVNWAFGWVRFLDRYLDMKTGNGKTVLELGSSLGYFSKVFKDRGFDVTGSDISSFIVKKANHLQKDIKFIQLNIEKEIKLEKKYDFIVAFEVLEHLENPTKALINIKKLLNKNGVLIFSTPYPTKISLSDSTHINVHKPVWWINLSKKIGFLKARQIHATFVPFLYKISKYLSIGLPFRSNIPYVNSTVFLIFNK